MSLNELFSRPWVSGRAKGGGQQELGIDGARAMHINDAYDHTCPHHSGLVGMLQAMSLPLLVPETLLGYLFHYREAHEAPIFSGHHLGAISGLAVLQHGATHSICL